MQDITLPEVQSLKQNARFFKDGERDMVEISYAGSKDTLVKKVGPEHMAAFRNEWDAFCDGRPAEKRKGTALTDVVNEVGAETYIARNVHTLEELAALNDGQCQSLGHGTLTDRTTARKLLTQRKVEQEERSRKLVSDLSATIGPVPAEKYAARGDMEATNAKIDALTASVTALVGLLAEKKKPGPKKKDT